MADTILVKEVAVKQDDGTLGSYQKLGGTFREIIDDRNNKGNFTLEQFFDNYLDFMQNTTFVYTGIDKPANTHVGIWIDTSKTNQE